MCNTIRFLESLDEHHFTAICEHDTLHLSWNRGVLFLSLDEFFSLDAVLDEAIAAGCDMSPDDGLFCNEKDGRYTVWVYDMAFRMDINDFLLFTDMVSRTAAQLESHKPIRKIPDITVCYLPGRTIPKLTMLYSPN